MTEEAAKETIKQFEKYIGGIASLITDESCKLKVINIDYIELKNPTQILNWEHRFEVFYTIENEKKEIGIMSITEFNRLFIFD